MSNLREKAILIKLTAEEDELLTKMAQARGTNRSSFARESIFKGYDKIYDKRTECAIHNISYILLERLPQYCSDENFINECRNGVNELWLSLK